MANAATAPPLTPTSISAAHDIIKPYIHHTPVLTNRTLNLIASSSDPAAWLDSTPTSTDSPSPSAPHFNFYFKCENLQRIGAFKARGAFHAVSRLVQELGIDEVKRRGVVTHSSGNHAQALALAAHTFSIPSYIVMPQISTASKIAGTRSYTSNVIFSGSTSTEREAVVAEVIKDKNAILVPPYDHPDIILGQGTVGKEMQEQVESMGSKLDAVVAPIGGGGLLAGVAAWFGEQDATLVFGAEPSFEGADDAARGLREGKRVESVKSLTIADGLRTPVGLVNWDVVSDRKKVEAVYGVGEEEIKMTMRLVMERMKVVVEPSACVPLAVVLFNKEFRKLALEEQKSQGKDVWNIGVVFSGGNTTMATIAKLFG